ncbi:hypothetical protein LCGC14_2552030 [marine sediment metagenome]|uniref:Uncharacterized protein n=1 Tax=marine sediment metagenome TaxID=412755 RepID=A0A0F9BAI9_9ZZZZ
MKTICPYCNYKADSHETIDKQRNPKDGEISFCMNCGEISEFKDNSIIKIDLNSLDKNLKQEINKIRIAWLRTTAIENLKK